MSAFHLPVLALAICCTGSAAAPAARHARSHPPPTARHARPHPAPVDIAAARAVAVEIRTQAAGKLKDFYATRDFWPIWAASGHIGSAADTLLTLLENADLDGLEPASYRPDDLRAVVRRARSGDSAQVASAELALSEAFAHLVTDMRGHPRIGMTYADPAVKPQRQPPETILRAAAMKPSLRDYLRAMGWMNPQYVRVRKLLAKAREGGNPPSDIGRLRLDLDRARVLPSPWVRHIVVDAASGRLWYYDAGKQVGTMRVVVGAAKTPTPMLAGVVRYAILNPYWNIPDYLIRDKFAPRFAKGETPDSLGFDVLSDWSPNARTLDPTEVDWEAIAKGGKLVRLRERPGGENSMGKVKFIFPNKLGIYLHDTPERALLAKPDRHFSNGCIRLEDAPGLGKWLLGKPLAGLSDQPEQAVPLPVPVPVYITYITVAPTKTGIGFLADIYNRDGRDSG
jgi:murein L,D-transpeptidase YcbB/YkuD